MGRVCAAEVVAVIGAGTMGHALALVHALGGCDVRLFDSNADALPRAMSLIEAVCETLMDAGVITLAERQAALGRIAAVDTLPKATRDASLIVEAVVEQEQIKREVFAAIDAVAPLDAIIASNTSYLDVFALVPARRQEFAAIAHWYTPPYIIDLVDLAPGPQTTAGVMTRLCDLYSGMGKVALVFPSLVPGYVANRLQMALNLECLRIIDEGWADAEAIDLSIRHGLAHRLALQGHMRKMDYTGLEMVRNGIGSRRYSPPEASGTSPVIERLIEAGRTGVRAGAGFYDYGDSAPDLLFRQRDRQLLALKVKLAEIEGDKG